MKQNPDEQSELNALVSRTADDCLAALALLGAYGGEVTPKYRMTVAQCVVGVLAATAATRICIEHVTGSLEDKQRWIYLCRLIAAAFDLDSQELVQESLAA